MTHTTRTEATGEIRISSGMERCAEICLKCYKICNETLQHCLEKGAEHVSSKHITLLLDCAKICQTSADFLTRNSEQHAVTCNACAEICAECAENCRQLKDRDMDECADVCDRCAKSCREMVTH